MATLKSPSWHSDGPVVSGFKIKTWAIVRTLLLLSSYIYIAFNRHITLYAYNISCISRQGRDLASSARAEQNRDDDLWTTIRVLPVAMRSISYCLVSLNLSVRIIKVGYSVIRELPRRTKLIASIYHCFVCYMRIKINVQYDHWSTVPKYTHFCSTLLKPSQNNNLVLNMFKHLK